MTYMCLYINVTYYNDLYVFIYKCNILQYMCLYINYNDLYVFIYKCNILQWLICVYI